MGDDQTSGEFGVSESAGVVTGERASVWGAAVIPRAHTPLIIVTVIICAIASLPLWVLFVVLCVRLAQAWGWL